MSILEVRVVRVDLTEVAVLAHIVRTHTVHTRMSAMRAVTTVANRMAMFNVVAHLTAPVAGSIARAPGFNCAILNGNVDFF